MRTERTSTVAAAAGELSSQRRSTSFNAEAWSRSLRIGRTERAVWAEATISYLARVDAVVVAMCTDVPNEDDAGGVLDGNDKPVRVALDVEDDPIPRQKRSTRVPRLDVTRPGPPRLLRFAEPSPQRRFGVAVDLPELAQSSTGDHP